MVDYVYTDHAQYTIKTYAKMALFPLVQTGPLSTERKHERPRAFSAQNAYIYMAVTMQKTALLTKYFGLFQLGDVPPVGMSRNT